MTSATIDGEERNHTDVVNRDQTFNIFIVLVDQSTRQALTKVQWSNWTWRGDATLYQLPKFNREGALNGVGNTTVTVEPTATRIRVSGVSINVTGMYMVNVRLASTSNQHSINVVSKVILVTDDSGKTIGKAMFDRISERVDVVACRFLVDRGK